jgi:hydroxypyruvate isomerase
MEKEITLLQVQDAMHTIMRKEKERDDKGRLLTLPKKFNYGIIKNKGLMETDMATIIADEKYIEEAEKERVTYLESVATKDKDGKPKMEIIDQYNAVTRSVEKVQVFVGINDDDPKLKEILDRKEKAVTAHKEFLEKTKVKLNIHEIAWEDVPDLALADQEKLTFMIGEPK